MFSDTFLRSVRICAIVVFFFHMTQPNALALSDPESGSSDDGSDGGDSGSNSGGPGDRQESWVFVSLPRYGLAPLQEVTEPGSPANTAWSLIGEPLDFYQQIPMNAPFANENNGAIVVLMLPERCMGDYNSDGAVDLYDLIVFAEAYIAMDPIADLTRDQRIDVRDQILFFQLATMPCVSAW
jgi:hypothetical protein